MIIVDASDSIVGRVATEVAQMLLKSENVHIINAEKAAVIGSTDTVLKHYRRRIKLHAKGNPTKGPKFPRRADLLFKRSIRGMLPTQSRRGVLAFKRCKVHIGVPEKLSGKETIKIKGAEVDETKKHIKLGELSVLLGAKKLNE